MEKDIMILEENYTGTASAECCKMGQAIDDIITQYVGILNTLTDGRLKGQTAEKLAEFAGETKRLLSQMAEPIAGECARKQSAYMTEIRAEDK